jgi:heterodisulfide reductase subunit A-like polyferredoxin
VASLPLEGLYDRAREAGVDIVKHDGSVELRPAEAPAEPPAVGAAANGLEILFTDSLLGTRAILRCALAGVSRYGVRSAADAALAAALGLSTDGLGQLQENNLHLAPEATNRPGLFVVGSCRGQHYLPQIQAEARAAALAVHRLLAPGFLAVQLSSPTVDPDKCALCLTCVRACPYKAMVVDAENEAAKSLPEACQRCGICVGECPARAIQLPAWSDAALLAQLAEGQP